MSNYTVISADSHFIEPPTLWTERLDKKYRDQAPHVEENEKGSFFVAPGGLGFPRVTCVKAGRSQA